MDNLKSKLRTLVTYMWAYLMVLHVNCRKELFFWMHSGGRASSWNQNPFKISAEIIKGSEEDPNLLKLSPLTD